jgi:hypothetical protein
VAPPVFKSPSIQYSQVGSALRLARATFFGVATLPKITQWKLGVGSRWALLPWSGQPEGDLKRSQEEPDPRRPYSLHLGCSL